MITVPPQQWLGSPVDEAASRQRRYSASELHTTVKAAGFRIMRSTSFVTVQFPMMLASRLAARGMGKASDRAAPALNPMLDRAPEAIMRIEHLTIKSGMSLPISGALLVLPQPNQSP